MMQLRHGVHGLVVASDSAQALCTLSKRISLSSLKRRM